MDALTIVDLKRMHKAGLLTLDEFLKAAAPLIKQAGAQYNARAQGWRNDARSAFWAGGSTAARRCAPFGEVVAGERAVPMS